MRDRDGLIYVVDGVQYRWMGAGLGAQLESLEWRRAPAGTQRTLFGFTFTIFMTQRRGLRVTHSWGINSSPSVDTINAEIRNFKASAS